MLPRVLAAAFVALGVHLAHAQPRDSNLQNLLAGLETGTPVTLLTPLTNGMVQVTSFSAPTRMSQAEATAYVDRARQELARLGVQQASAEEIARMLAGGPLVVPAGNVTVPGLLNTAGIAASIASQQVAAGTPVNGAGPGYGASAAGGSAPALPAPAREEAIRQLAAIGIINPSEDQIRTALVGGSITTVNGVYPLPGVLRR
ncbi:MAG TPA: hypothetical protein VEU32_12135 [Burkholderiales bacterium]|nr:hypothetical protein [Burkholderiales bacterium]